MADEETRRLVREAEVVAQTIMGATRALLERGDDPRSVRRRYVDPLLGLLEDVELRALVAASDDQSAMNALHDLLGRLRDLRSKATAELGRHPRRLED